MKLQLLLLAATQQQIGNVVLSMSRMALRFFLQPNVV